jgi:uncharacterized sulfatase
MFLSRRDFLKAAGISAAAFVPGGCTDTLEKPLNAKAAVKQPNILWISCEDISPHLGCYDEEFALTPNIDNFAKESVRFTRAFTVHGVCAPSRSGIITGMYPSSLGSCNMRCRADKPESIKCFTEYLRTNGYYCTNNSKEDYNFKAPKQAWDESSRKAHWKNRPDGKPFFAVFNFTTTHESKLWNSADFENTHPPRLKDSERQKPENVKIPPIYPDTPAVRRDFARLFERITELDYFLKDRLDEIKDAGLYEDTIIFFWSDHGNGLPRAKRWLYDSGTLVPLIIRIPKKFRDNNQAQPGSTDDQLVNFIDLGPTSMNLAGIEPPGHMQGRPFLGHNLPAERNYIFGARDRIDEIYDMVRSVRNKRYRYIRNFNPFTPYLPYLEYAERCNTMKEMRRLHADRKLNKIQAQWMADRRPSQELYDLQNDPWETKNLAGNPEYAGIKKHLEEALYNWMIRMRDSALLPEPMMKRLAKKYGSEYAILHRKNGEKRTKRLLKLAMIASEPKDFDRKIIYKALQSKDAAQRYWAVTALGQLTPGTDVEKLQSASTDKEPSVRIAAARSLYWAGQKKLTVELLEKELKNTDQIDEVLHFALNVLEKIGGDAKAVIPTVRQLNTDKKKSEYIKRLAKRLIQKFQEE